MSPQAGDDAGFCPLLDGCPPVGGALAEGPAPEPFDGGLPIGCPPLGGAPADCPVLEPFNGGLPVGGWLPFPALFALPWLRIAHRDSKRLHDRHGRLCRDLHRSNCRELVRCHGRLYLIDQCGDLVLI
jgi:hypothetical protein